MAIFYFTPTVLTGSEKVFINKTPRGEAAGVLFKSCFPALLFPVLLIPTSIKYIMFAIILTNEQYGI